jgi:hypothetical protein
MTECFRCGGTEDLERFGSGHLCLNCRPDGTEEKSVDGTTSTGVPEDTPGDEAVREHYQNVDAVLEELASVEDIPTGAFCGNAGWYTRRPATDIADLEDGIDGWGRVKTLERDLYTITSNVCDDEDARSLYALTNYSDAFHDESAFTRTDDGPDWIEDKPTPEYGDIQAFAPFADIDLESEHKERPLPEAKQAIVEEALAEYIDAFAELMGGRDAVFALDSVGGAYVMGAPAATLPIAEEFDEDARERIFAELADRLNDWLADIDEEVREAIPEAEGLFEADYVNNKNRQYKAPLSIHKRIDGVVHPLNTNTSRSTDYPFVPIDDVDDGLVDETVSWAQEFTDTGHADHVGDLVATLWPDEFQETGDWQAALERWVETQREQDRLQAARRAELETGEPVGTNTADDVNSGSTDNLDEIYRAVENLDAFEVAEKTIVHRWTENVSEAEDHSGDGKKAFIPLWGTNYESGNANYIDEKGTWVDTANGDHGTVVEMALIAAGGWTRGKIAKGADWFRGLEELRELGFAIPEYEPDSGGETEGSAQPTSALPLGQLEALDHHERKRAAKKRGLDWPSTREARDELFATITEVMRNQDTAVVDAPTSLGKSHTVATTPWNNDQTLDGITGNAPVVHLHATRDARDEAIEAAREADVDYFALQSRHEACDVAAGDYDPPATDADEELEYTPITMNGTAASEWLADMCEGRGIPFSAAHRRLEEHNDQGVDLPCCSGETTYDEEEGDFDETPSTCRAISQWESYRAVRDDVDVVFATHNFAHVPGLRLGTNLVIDEEPGFVEDLEKNRVERAVTAYLQAIDAPVTTWEAFIQLSLNDQYGTDAAAEREQLRDALHQEPPLEHYFEDDRAHTLAPALARAIFNAEERGNGRRFGKTPHEPPRLDAQAVDDDAWNREWVSVTLDDDNELRTVRSAPDFSQARSVVGLDAWPARPKWMVNVHPSIQIKDVLDSEERQLWRRFERGLRVVQVGDATRPLASGKYFNEGKAQALCEHLVDEYGDNFRTALTTKNVEDRLETLMQDAGCTQPDVMTYGSEKSRNDFAQERIGLVNGCLDPGDKFVVDLLAELDLDAEPTIVDCGHCEGTGTCDGHCEIDTCSTHDEGCDACDGTGEQRESGRTFSGPDADVAQEILASVRENHTAQAAGRYARDPGEDDSHATVFVRTDAMPAGLADVEVPGVEWVFTDTQREIVDALRSDAGTKTAREIAESVGCSKEHVRTTLKRLCDDEFGNPAVQAFEKAGDHGATVYADSGAPNAGVVDTTSQLTTNDHVLDSYTWSLAIRDPTVSTEHEETATTESGGGEWDWQSAASTGDPPSD